MCQPPAKHQNLGQVFLLLSAHTPLHFIKLAL
jgi:hypothetical protein